MQQVLLVVAGIRTIDGRRYHAYYDFLQKYGYNLWIWR